MKFKKNNNSSKTIIVIRTHLFDAMKEEGKRLNNIIFELKKVNELNTMFKDLYQYCSLTLMGGQYTFLFS